MQTRRITWPLGAFVLGSGAISAVYFWIVSLAEGFDHALTFFVDDRRYILPLIFGFGIQSALYIILKKQLFVPVAHTGPSSAVTGVSGTTSSLAMAACCAHHVTDVLPILGLSAAAAALAEYQQVFMFLGLVTTLIGVLVMIRILLKARQAALGRPAVNQIGTPALLVVGAAAGILGLAVLNPFGPAPAVQPAQPTPALEQPAGLAGSYPQVLEVVPTNTELWFSGQTQADQQGAVMVEVTPLHLNQQNNTLYFGIAMNTHSVDLGMDLAKLAELTLEDGTVVPASHWDGPAGGHHVSGVLSFTLNGPQIELLLNVKQVELELLDVDAAVRTFLWQASE